MKARVRAAIAAGYDIEFQGPPVIEPVSVGEVAEEAVSPSAATSA